MVDHIDGFERHALDDRHGFLAHEGHSVRWYGPPEFGGV